MIARLLLLFAMVVAPLASAAAETLTVMTYNVRYPSPDDGADRWENRRDLLGDTIRKSAPDLIGTQELFQSQGDYITAKLPRYSWFGIDRRGGHDDEHMGIFYRSDRLKLIEQGNFWLSDTPEVVGGISWGHPFPRMVNWGLFETRSGRRFRLYNTHFPYRGEDEAARTKAARESTRGAQRGTAPCGVVDAARIIIGAAPVRRTDERRVRRARPSRGR